MTTERIDSSKPQRFVLNESGTAWIELSHVPSELAEYAKTNFRAMFNLHPEERGKVIMFETEVDAHRWYRSYMNVPRLDAVVKDSSYMFSGYADGGDFPLPEEFCPFLEFMNSGEPLFNQVVVNWYETGKDYIPYHSDFCRGMAKCAPINVLTLTETDEHPRMFCIKPNKGVSALYERVEIPCINGLIIKLCGETNDLFKHGVPKIPVGEKRISLSFRTYE